MRHVLFFLVAMTGCLASASASAVTGTLTSNYGAPLVVQTTSTTLDVTSDASTDLALGYELDAGYGYIADDALHLFLTGNLAKWIQLEGWIPQSYPIDLFLDTRYGGQNQLLASNPTVESVIADLKKMTGLTFDAGFSADWWFTLQGSYSDSHLLKAYQAELPDAGGGAGAYLGTTPCGGPGTLSGGTNPFGVLVTLDDHNMAGVNNGCGAASGEGVATGMEWVIPLAAIGNPPGCIRVCAFASSTDHSMLFNQVLGPLPSGTCNLGAASVVSFASIPGPQYFTICPIAVTVRNTSWGTIKTVYR